MKKSMGLLIALNRKSFLILGVMLCLAGFGIFAWRSNAQRNATDIFDLQTSAERNATDILSTRKPSPPTGSKTLSAGKLTRILADKYGSERAAKIMQTYDYDSIMTLIRPTPAAASVNQPQAPLAAGNPVIYGYDFDVDHLIAFNANTPGTLTSNVAVTGLQVITANNTEYVAGIDFRPADGLLYGVTAFDVTGTAGARLVKFSLTKDINGNVTAASVASVNAANTFTTTNDLFQGFDFNPVADHARNIRTPTQTNARFNPADGTSTTETPLAYAVGDAHFGAVPSVVHTAYNNNTPGATSTTLYGIDRTQDTLVTIGSVGGAPDAPASGLLHTVGPLGVDVGGFGGFDIQQGTDIGYAALNVIATSTATLYRINLKTGQATVVGTISNGADRIDGLTLPYSATGGSADLSITKSDGTTIYSPGGSATYTITVTNPAGGDPVVGATVSDPTGANASILSDTWTCSGAGGATCTASGAGSINDTAVNLPVGSSVTYIMTVLIKPAAVGALVNTATVTAPAGVTDPTLGNNAATDSDNVFTAAGVTVSGQVLTPDGRGLRNASVVIVDSHGVATTVVTNAFGFYQFDDVQTGDTYVIGVVSKHYRFSSRILQVTDTLSGVDFMGEE